VLIDPKSATLSCERVSPHARQCRGVIHVCAAVEREVPKRRFFDASRQVVIGDGANWIWNICSEIFPQTIQILDIYHTKEKSWDLGKRIYGRSTDLARQWSAARIVELNTGNVEGLVEASTHDGVIQALGFCQRNGDRMRYGEFRTKGLCVSSAVVEAGCKNVIGTRLKKAECTGVSEARTKLRLCVVASNATFSMITGTKE